MLFYWFDLFFPLSVRVVFPLTGARAEAAPRGKMNEAYDIEGIQGLKALGVRDLNYRLAFLACSVKSSNPRVSLNSNFMCHTSVDKLKKNIVLCIRYMLSRYH